MNTRNAFGANSITDPEPPDAAELTLRLLAKLPPPEGIEDRVLAGLRSAPRGGRVLDWREMLRPPEAWMRSAAAAAIVFVIAGGGWTVYTHVQPQHSGAAAVAIPHPGAAGGFSSAGAMRTPETVNGPVVASPAVASPAVSSPAASEPTETKPATKTNAPAARTLHPRAHAGRAFKAQGQPSVTVAN